MELPYWRVALVLVHPVALLPLLLWVLWKYVPLVKEVGRVRLYLLVGVVIGSIAVQVTGVHRAHYPLTTWTMYGHPAPEPTAWRFVVISADGHEEHLPWELLAPVPEPRAFQRSLVATLRPELGRGPVGPEGAVAEGRETVGQWLGEFGHALDARGRGDPLQGIRVEACNVEDFARLGPSGIPCRMILELAAGPRPPGDLRASR